LDGLTSVAFSSVKSGLQGGRFASEWVAGIDRNQWPLSIGIGGRLRPEYAGADKIVGEYIVRVVHLKKRVADLDQARIELKIGSTDLSGDFIDIFGTELWFFGKAYHQVPFV
jgi:hypothetical protein